MPGVRGSSVGSSVSVGVGVAARIHQRQADETAPAAGAVAMGGVAVRIVRVVRVVRVVLVDQMAHHHVAMVDCDDSAW